jgi:AraC-like DNA-binding protein
VNDDERALPVPAALRPWLSGLSVGGLDRERTVSDEPDHATTLVLRTAPGHRGDLVVMGPRTRAGYHFGEPGPSCVKARIQPGRAGALLGRSVRDLVDKVVPLSDFWGELPETASPASFEDLLLGQLAERRPPRDLVRDAATLLTAVGVRDTALKLHVSERHLRTLFTDGVGVSPKHFARIDRVRTVLARVRTRDWARLAAEAGYYDHSHMTAEFRHLMGVPPSAFAAGELPAATACGR